MFQGSECEKKCSCKKQKHKAELIVLTGGPGAGKTAVLEMARKLLCRHVAILPEAASVVFGGGFWRLQSLSARRAAQRAIFHVQREMEQLVLEEQQWGIGLCDRGTLDGLAYWGPQEALFWKMSESSLHKEYRRYKLVIHLRSPSIHNGYNWKNPLRIETAEQAAIIDERIHRIWKRHPNYVLINSSANFFEKANAALNLIEANLPACCR